MTLVTLRRLAQMLVLLPTLTVSAIAQDKGDADVKVSSFQQNGDNLSVVIEVEVEANCLRSSGDVEFKATVRKQYSDGDGEILTRRGFASWSRVEETNFVISASESGFFDDDEEIVDVPEIDVTEYICELSEELKGSREDANPPTRFIDAEVYLMEAAGLQLPATQEDWCPTGCTGICSKPPKCILQRRLVNIQLEDIQSISYDYPDSAQSIVVKRETRPFLNCSSSPLSEDETVTITTKQTFETTLKTVLTNVRTEKFSVSVDWKIIKDVLGFEAGGSVESVSTLETTNSSSSTLEEEVVVERPISVSVPAWTKWTQIYSVEEKDIIVPFVVTATFDADVERYHEVSGFNYAPIVVGEVWGDPVRMGRLSRFSDQQKRTITLNGQFYIAGSDRVMSTSRFEEALSEDDLRCRLPN